jgi:glyoxylase-like metal-dependent hydrolase (beta-lactamase superfamily II)
LPGHSPDSLVFHPEGSGVVFVGDTLFAGSIGRADLPGGDLDQLLDGIARHLLVLPADTRVFPGHGPETTIGREAATNPFLR